MPTRDRSTSFRIRDRNLSWGVGEQMDGVGRKAEAGRPTPDRSFPGPSPLAQVGFSTAPPLPLAGAGLGDLEKKLEGALEARGKGHWVGPREAGIPG